MLQGKSRLLVGGRLTRLALLPVLALVAVEGSACAMAEPQAQAVSCSVRNAGKLPPSLGGADAVCAAIKNAVLNEVERSTLKSAAVNTRVLVESSHKISAVATMNGNELPKQNVSISDRELTQRSIQMLANAIAAELARSIGPAN